MRKLPLLFSSFMALVAHGAPVTFGTGPDAFVMDFVNIGNPGNAPDSTGFGAVNYEYAIGTYEVRAGMFESYNNLSGGPALPVFNGGPPNPELQSNRAISWNHAARFVNWLNTSSGFAPAYKFTTNGANDDPVVWSPSDTGYDPNNLFRNRGAIYVLPSEDEWYKAAYYDPSSATYFDYPTGSNSVPTAVASGTAANTAVYNQPLFPRPPVDQAGGLSPYGTMAQGGSEEEWMESTINGSNANGSDQRIIRGGSFGAGPNELRSTFRRADDPSGTDGPTSFRVVQIPEPSAALLSLIGLVGLSFVRRRAA